MVTCVGKRETRGPGSLCQNATTRTGCFRDSASKAPEPASNDFYDIKSTTS